MRSMSQVQLTDIQSQKSKVISSKSHHKGPPVMGVTRKFSRGGHPFQGGAKPLRAHHLLG